MLNAASVPDYVALCRSEDRLREIETLFSEAKVAFSNIEYELDVNSRTANAQAYARGNARVVRLYGGLAFHPMVGTDTLVFTLLHETGHHFAQGRRFAADPMLACDCAADEWAVTIGAETLQRVSRRTLDIVKALAGLDAMILSLSGDLSTLEAQGRFTAAQSCWELDWPTRKSCLSSGREIAVARRCCGKIR
jgi:hypothetical protein